MNDIQAGWVGLSKEQYNNKNEYCISFALLGQVTIVAKNKEEALENAQEMTKFELIDFVEEKQFN